MRNKRTSILAVLAAAVLTIAGFTAATVTVSPAQAAEVLMATIGMKSGNAPKPTCPAPFVFSGKKANCVPCPQGSQYDQASATCKSTTLALPQVCKTEGNVKSCASSPYVSIGQKKVSASDMASGRVWIGSDMLLKGTQYNSRLAHWTKGGFWNSMIVDGKRRSYWDPIPGKLCPNRNSPTGWVKCGGGTTGRDCSNVASEKKPPFPVIKGVIINVRSTANVFLPLWTKASVSINDKANGCLASASSTGMVRIRLNNFVHAKGNVDIKMFGGIFAKLENKVSASTDCKPSVTMTLPTQTVTTPGPTQTTTVPVTTTVQTTTTVPVTTTVQTTTTVPVTTTTTTPTTTTQPKSDVDLCINIDGKQTAVPAMYKKDPPDLNTPGNCIYVGP